jgi:hypothetical protein
MGSTDRELLERAVAAAFTHDAHGRIGYDNEPAGDRAPRFVLARSASANLWRLRDDLTDEVVRQLDAVAAAEPVTADLRAPPRHLDAYLTVLRASQAIAAVEFGPDYRFPDHLPTPGITTNRNAGQSRAAARHGWRSGGCRTRLRDGAADHGGGGRGVCGVGVL